MSIKFLAHGNNGIPLSGFKPMLTAVSTGTKDFQYWIKQRGIKLQGLFKKDGKIIVLTIKTRLLHIFSIIGVNVGIVRIMLYVKFV